MEPASPAKIARTRSTKVTRSPHQWTIDQKLLGGEALVSIRDWLAEEAIPPENISIEALRRHLKKIAPTRALRQTYYARLHHNIDVKVNVLQELYNSIEVLKSRASISLKQEAEEGKPSAKARADMSLLIDTLARILRFELQLGIRDDKAPQGDVSMLADIEKFRKDKGKVPAVIEPEEQEKEQSVEVTGSSSVAEAE